MSNMRPSNKETKAFLFKYIKQLRGTRNLDEIVSRSRSPETSPLRINKTFSDHHLDPEMSGKI